MKGIKIYIMILGVFVVGYLLAYFGSQFIHNRIYTGDKNIEYVVSTEFTRYNPEYQLIDEFDNGVELRLYEGVYESDGVEKVGYVFVIKDIKDKYRYSFLASGRGDIYENNSKYIEGTSYIALHRQHYHYTRLLMLYTYVYDELQYYYTPTIYHTETEVFQKSTTEGNYYTFTNPPSTFIWTYPLSMALIVGTYFGTKELKRLNNIRRKRLVKYADTKDAVEV